MAKNAIFMSLLPHKLKKTKKQKTQPPRLEKNKKRFKTPGQSLDHHCNFMIILFES